MSCTGVVKVVVTTPPYFFMIFTQCMCLGAMNTGEVDRCLLYYSTEEVEPTIDLAQC